MTCSMLLWRDGMYEEYRKELIRYLEDTQVYGTGGMLYKDYEEAMCRLV